MSSKIVLKNTQAQEFSITHPDNVGAVILNSHEIATKGFTEQSIGKMGQTHTATATFTSATNQIIMTGIVTALGLEVGDVITFDNANALNNKPHTVESITDNNTIIVNYEHCGNRGDGSLKLFNQTVTSANCKLLAKWYNAPIGLGQGWVSVGASRLIGSNYTSIANRPMQIIVPQNYNAGTFSQIKVGELTINQAGTRGSAGGASYSGLIIPPSTLYSVPSGGGRVFIAWYELR